MTVVKEVQAVPIDKDIPLTSACLIACGVVTGVGSVFNRANIQPGDNTAVFGAGGVGLSVIQGLRIKAAGTIIAVDTLLLLRPTQSATLFLQQLGRGLRHHTGKSSCLVLDFIGQHRDEFRFDVTLSAVTRISRVPLSRHRCFPQQPHQLAASLSKSFELSCLAFPSTQNKKTAFGAAPAFGN